VPFLTSTNENTAMHNQASQQGRKRETSDSDYKKLSSQLQRRSEKYAGHALEKIEWGHMKLRSQSKHAEC